MWALNRANVFRYRIAPGFMAMKRANLIACVLTIAASAIGLGQTERQFQDKETITADSIRREGSVMHLAGDVTIETEHIVLRADSADFNKDTQEIQAHGKVSVRLKPQLTKPGGGESTKQGNSQVLTH